MSEIDALIEDFELLEEWEERYRYLIEMGQELPEMHEAMKTPASKISGCISRVWIVSTEDEGKVHFAVDSDTHVVKGLLAVLMKLFDGKTKEEIAAVDAEAVFKKLGLDKHLSPNRRSGLNAMLERFRD